jgi:hypothetical protein
LEQCWHFQQQMKNKVGKHFIVIGKYGSKKLIKHSEIVCFMKTSVRNTARNIICKHIDTFVTASYGSEFCITHKCTNVNNDIVSKHDTPERNFKSRTQVIFVVQDKKNYAVKFKEKSCHALPVKKKLLHLTLVTNLSNSLKSISFQENDHKIKGQILLFHFPKRG